MAIKVNGTTVIDNSRNLSNVGGLKTVNGTSIVGSGNISAGASTSYNAVGTYALASIMTTGQYNEGTTRSGSSLRPANTYASSQVGYRNSASMGGTWRLMGATGYYNGSTITRADFNGSLFVRIS